MKWNEATEIMPGTFLEEFLVYAYPEIKLKKKHFITDKKGYVIESVRLLLMRVVIRCIDNGIDVDELINLEGSYVENVRCGCCMPSEGDHRLLLSHLWSTHLTKEIIEEHFEETKWDLFYDMRYWSPLDLPKIED